MNVLGVGALCFGIVVGWVTSRTLRRSTAGGLTDIATVLGAIGGAAVTGLFKPTEEPFGLYCIGLFAGFFTYLLVAIAIARKEGTAVGDWLGSEPLPTGTRRPDPIRPNPNRPNPSVDPPVG